MTKAEKKEKLYKFLEWLITPQNEKEKIAFKNCVGDYVGLKKKMPTFTEAELIEQINIQLKPYKLTINAHRRR